MNALTNATRWILTASLLFSLNLASLYPRLAEGIGRTVVIADGQGVSSCCCGTADGSCCGMACCSAQAPSPAKSSPSPKPCDDGGQPHGLALVASGTLDGSSAVTTRLDLGHAATLSGTASLIALSVRLNL
jgi:hypothetical protein